MESHSWKAAFEESFIHGGNFLPWIMEKLNYWNLTEFMCDFCTKDWKVFPRPLVLLPNFFSQCTPIQMKIEQNPQVEICWKEFNLSINFSEFVSLLLIHLLFKCSINKLKHFQKREARRWGEKINKFNPITNST